MKEIAFGVLLLAHGGSPSWNRDAEKIMRDAEAELAMPVELTLGMADLKATQVAVEQLKKRGADKIVAVPLFVNSRSEVMDQTRFILGVSAKPSAVLRDALTAAAKKHAHHAAKGGGHHHSFSEKPIDNDLPLVFVPALDDHPLVAQVLLERALKLSKDAKKEVLIVIGHGPNDEQANEIWLGAMRKLAGRARREGGFAAGAAYTIRDDAPEPVRQAAVEKLRERVAKETRSGRRAVVVPLLLARGGIESHIVDALVGLKYAWDGATLAPHPNLARWVVESARAGAVRSDMRISKEKP